MDFDSVFGSDVSFDTMFEGQDDGDLIDKVCGFNEAGGCDDTDVVNDFDDIHNQDWEGDADDLRGIVGKESKKPSGAEGTDSDPAIDLALGEDNTGTDPFSTLDKGKYHNKSESDDFYKFWKDPDSHTPSSQLGDGPDVNMDDTNIEGEFDKIAESAEKAAMGVDMDMGSDYDDLGYDGDTGSGTDDLDFNDSFSESDQYEEGDADLIDLVGE